MHTFEAPSVLNRLFRAKKLERQLGKRANSALQPTRARLLARRFRASFSRDASRRAAAR